MKKAATEAGAGFASLGVPQMLVDSLARMGADAPTPVQQAAIPAAIWFAGLFG
jgi:superfamily II DNA/RNA helicase